VDHDRDIDPATRLRLEAAAFDSQIEERVAHGHIPDLRRLEPCTYFFNNPWRDPETARVDFGEQVERILAALDRHVGRTRRECRILEVGCGPGYLALELARSGYAVIGLDLAPSAIRVAQRFADEDPWKAERAPLRYMCADFFSSPELEHGQFDAVVFLGSMHHFPDQAGVVARCRQLLRQGGIILGHEPVRDKVTPLASSMLFLCKVLASAGSNFYTEVAIPENKEAIESRLEAEFLKMKYESEDGDKLQSVNDNEAGYAEIMVALSQGFEVLEEEKRYSFFHEIIGGLRYDADTNAKLARFLRDFDGHLCRKGLVEATEFLVVAKKS
jgi:2-polyprenyl-3-methyl-5-hydroxy-6-metoxy-1,4-benzoquinol methylase